jgi:hypothetical protein
VTGGGGVLLDNEGAGADAADRELLVALDTQPSAPSSSARCTVISRKPTPCTSPRTIARTATAPSFFFATPIIV